MRQKAEVERQLLKQITVNELFIKKMIPLREVKKTKMPLSHNITKLHKVLNICNIFLVNLCVIVARKIFPNELKDDTFIYPNISLDPKI